MPGLYPLNARAIPPSCDNQECLQTLPVSPGKQNYSELRKSEIPFFFWLYPWHTKIPGVGIKSAPSQRWTLDP